ncbi:prolyl oligopeptidase family serine peptidase [Naumannella halotolerans]
MRSMTQDRYAWLEDVEGEASLEWVRARNGERAADLVATDGFADLAARIGAILDSDARIPTPVRRGDLVYNFWTDAEHPRGLWRRTSPESWADDDPEWEVLLDLDALGDAEAENWVWHGAQVLRGGDGAYRRALVSLSRGGADADVVREFDLDTHEFVDDGFSLPESKGGAVWENADTLLVFRDFGPGSMTDSGYPRTVRRWHRDTPLEVAETLISGRAEDMYVGAHHDDTPGFERTLLITRPTFWTSQVQLLTDDGPVPIDVPASAEIDLHREWLSVELREDWTLGETVHAAGSLLLIDFTAFLAGDRDFRTAFAPTESVSLSGSTWTRNHLVLTLLDDVKSRVEVLTPGSGAFSPRPVEGVPAVGTIAVAAVDPLSSDDLWWYETDFCSPTSLSLVELDGSGALVDSRPLKSTPAFFDASGLVAEQHFATSADGTQVPWFLVRRADLEPDGSTPTLLYGYGGFEISLTPTYSGPLGAGWLERGGAYAVANIRGGGEYGPRWHTAALKQHRHRAYADAEAVARDLIARGITSPAHLGVQGGSNGGLLVGNLLVRSPELFGAIVCQVPLLDMLRYRHLLAGASWMAEYGDPDLAQEWEFIRTFSPYHLFDPERTYPPILFTTSTRDDRVHPAHARKMAALMLESGADVTYFENIEGGHGGAATNEQRAFMQALAYTFLAERLGLEQTGPRQARPDAETNL